MKKQTLNYILIVVLAALIAVSLPASFAKYTDSKTFTMNLSREGFFWNSWDTSARLVTLPKAGRYVIIAKGGDGANGYTYDSSGYSDYEYDGGIGGVVIATYTTTADNQQLYVCPGSAGVRPVKAEASASTVGAGGTNATGKFSGGAGNYVSGNGSKLSKQISSGGGGAATVVYKGSNSNTASNILLIAGGGGAAATWNRLHVNGIDMNWNGVKLNKNKTVQSGTGGNGGTNLSGTENTVSSPSSGKVFNGTNGNGDTDGSKNSYGTGGLYNNGGTGGSVNGQVWVFTNIISATKAGDGKTYSNNGTGGTAAYYGGGGGGGYSGGGGGAGTSIDIAAGGGGGGSSFVANSLSVDTSYYSTMVTKATNNTATGTDSYGNVRNGAIPTQYPFGAENKTADGNGYVIIMGLDN